MVNMARTANIFVGSKEDFALDLAFEADPDGGHSATPEESVSWGSMEVWVHGKNLCSHVEEGELVPSVHWYLLPVIEWLAANWDPMLHEERLPNRNAGDYAWESLQETRFPPASCSEKAEGEWRLRWQDWWLRHSLHSCRSGALFPDVVIRRWQDMVEVSWGNWPVVGVPEDVVFIHPQGFWRLNPLLVARPLYDLLQAATTHLADRLPSSRRLREASQRVEAIRADSKETRVAWLAGLGSSREAVATNWQKVTTVFQKAAPQVSDYLLGVGGDGLVLEGSCHAALMFGSAAPTLYESDLNVLAGKLIELYAVGSESKELSGLVAHEPISFGAQPAWQVGYRLAERVIEQLDLVDQTRDSVDVSAILDKLGIRQEEIQLSDDTIRGVAVAGPHHKASILVNLSDRHNHTIAGKRFTIAHELCHILFDRTHGQKLAMASGPWAPLQVEKRANAFAAMLLMPPEFVRRAVTALRVPVTSEQGVREIRRQLETGFVATLEHLKNLGWLDPTTVEQIADERDERLAQQDAW